MRALNKVKARAIMGFLELSRNSIELLWHPEKGGIFEYGEFMGEKKYFVHIHPRLKNARIEVLIGGIAHEFAHISRELSITNRYAARTLQLYKESKAYRKKEEIETDLEVINRGFGEELLYLEDYRIKRNAHNGFGIPFHHLRLILHSRYNLPHPLTYQAYWKIFRKNGNAP